MSSIGGFIDGVFKGMDWREARDDRKRLRDMEDQRFDWEKEGMDWKREDRSYTNELRQNARDDRAFLVKERDRKAKDAADERQAFNETADWLLGKGEKGDSAQAVPENKATEQTDFGHSKVGYSLPSREELDAAGVSTSGQSPRLGVGATGAPDPMDYPTAGETGQKTAPPPPQDTAQADQPREQPKPQNGREMSLNDAVQAIGPYAAGYGQGQIDPRLAQAGGVFPDTQVAPLTPAQQREKAMRERAIAAKEGRLTASQDSLDRANRANAIAGYEAPQPGAMTEDPSVPRAIGTNAPAGSNGPLDERVQPRGALDVVSEIIMGKRAYRDPNRVDALIKSGVVNDIESQILLNGSNAQADQVIKKVAERKLNGITVPYRSQQRPQPRPQGLSVKPQSPAAVPAPMPQSAPMAENSAPAPVPSAQPAAPAPAPQQHAEIDTVGRANVSYPDMPPSGARAAARSADKQLSVVGKDGAVKTTPARQERAAKAGLDMFNKDDVPPIVEHYLRTGQYDKAKAFTEWVKQEKVQAGIKSYMKAAHAIALGDETGAEKALRDVYNNSSYFDDGYSVPDGGVKIIEGKDGKPAGAKITFHNDATGETHELEVNDADFMMMAYRELDPVSVFEISIQSVQATAKAEAASRAKANSPMQVEDAMKVITDAVKAVNGDVLDPTKLQQFSLSEIFDMAHLLQANPSLNPVRLMEAMKGAQQADPTGGFRRN